MRPLLSISVGVLFGSLLSAQAGEAYVATLLTGTPRTQLLHADLTSGKITALGRFAEDSLAPLALSCDPINKDVILAVDLGTRSRVLRLGVSGTSIVRRRVLADLVGRVTVIGFYSDWMHISVTGSAPGIYKIQRNGSTPKLIQAIPRITGAQAQVIGQSAIWLAESGSAALKIDPQMRLFDVNKGTTIHGPSVFKGLKPETLTGIAEVPTALVRVLLTDTAGRLLLSVQFATPTVVPVTPTLPAGGTRALRMRTAMDAVVLGGSAHPHLETTQFWSSPMKWTRLAGPFPGNPVAFDFVRSVGPRVLSFGDACTPGAPGGPRLGWSSLPKIGSQIFALQVRNARPNAPLLFVFGASDQRLGPVPLPITLPGGCHLLSSLELVFGTSSNASGFASVTLPIPNLLGLAGQTFFAQWLGVHGLSPLTFSSTEAAAIHIGR